MKILQIFGAVVGVHLIAFIFIFASPGCQSGSSSVPTPDATVPTASEAAPVTFSPGMANPPPVDLTAPPMNGSSSSGYATPTRPGSAAAVAVTPAAKPVADVAPVSTYTVGRGDSLWTIAKKNHLTVSELAKANNLSTGAALQPGKKLIIPGKPGAAPAMAPAASNTLTPAASSTALETPAAPAATGKAGMESVKHTVQVGESLGVIARKYQVSVGELAAANNITDPSKVRAGQQLVIPGFKAVGSKKPASGATTKATAKTSAPEKAAAVTPAPAPAPVIPKFEIAAPPPGQDLDAGLKDNPGTDVPTIKVEDSSAPKK